jgi:hypothetical protein
MVTRRFKGGDGAIHDGSTPVDAFDVFVPEDDGTEGGALSAMTEALMDRVSAPPEPEAEKVTQEAKASARTPKAERERKPKEPIRIPYGPMTPTRAPERDVADRVIAAAKAMSVAQAAALRTRDGIGFSNADYAFGSILSVANDAEGCALLLALYPQQSEALGIKPNDLDFAFPDEMKDIPRRTAALSLLSGRREQMRGSACWAELPDGRILVVPYCQGWDDTQALRRNGDRMPVGFAVPKANLPRLLAAYDCRLLDRDGLEALGRDIAAKGGVTPERPPLRGEGIRHLKRPDGSFLVKLNNPYGPAGDVFTNAVKSLGGVFSKADENWKGWQITGRAAKLLPAVLLESGIDFEGSGYPYHANDLRGVDRTLADNLANGVITIEVGRVANGTIDFTWLSQFSQQWDIRKACTNAGGTWNGIGITVAGDAITRVLTALDARADVDASAVAKAVVDTLKKRERVVGRTLELYKDIDNIPAITPTGRKLFNHQREGIRFLLCAGWQDPLMRGKILGDDMGLGKTVQAILAARMFDPDGKTLVICPASLKLNWAREWTQWLGDGEAEGIQVIKKSADRIKPGTRTLILNYDIVAKLQGEILDWRPDLMILDEAHNIKNPDSGRAKAIVGYWQKPPKPEKGAAFDAEKQKPKFVPGISASVSQSWMLTGTAIMNRPKEVWNYLVLANHPMTRRVQRFDKIKEPDAYKRSWDRQEGKPVELDPYRAFAIRFCGAKQEPMRKVNIKVGGKWQEKVLFKWNDDGASNLGGLAQEMRSINLRRLKSEVLDLPPKIRQIIPIELSEEDMRAYKSGLSELLERVTDGRLTSMSDGDIDSAIDKKMNNNVAQEVSELKQRTAIAKIPAAVDQIEAAVENGQKIIVFSEYLTVLDELQRKFPGSVRIDGSTTQKKRQQVVDSFQNDPNVLVFFGQTIAAGVGITLTAARDVLFVDRPWVPGLEDQAEDRAYRIGQTGTVNVRYLDAVGTFDDDLRVTLEEKRKIIKQFEDGGADGGEVDLDVVKALLKRVKEEGKRIRKGTAKG